MRGGGLYIYIILLLYYYYYMYDERVGESSHIHSFLERRRVVWFGSGDLVRWLVLVGFSAAAGVRYRRRANKKTRKRGRVASDGL